MHWNPYIDLRVAVSRAARATCKRCGVTIDRGTYRVEAVPVIGNPELLHVDCAAQRASDIARRKVLDRDPDWPEEALALLERHIPAGVPPAPRSYQRTPIRDIAYDSTAGGHQPCVYCGGDCPGEAGPSLGYAIRAFSIDGERRFHPACITEVAPGLCARVAIEGAERWPPEVRAFFAQALHGVAPAARSPWRNTAGAPELQRAPSARAACRYCEGKIEKGQLRLAREQLYGMRRTPVFFHVGCYAASDDYHLKMLELLMLRAEPEITREEVAALVATLPPAPLEDDDVAPLSERLLALFDAAARARAPQSDANAPRLTENVVDIPQGFFNA